MMRIATLFAVQRLQPDVQNVNSYQCLLFLSELVHVDDITQWLTLLASEA